MNNLSKREGEDRASNIGVAKQIKVFNVNSSKNQRRSSNLTPMYPPLLDQPSFSMVTRFQCVNTNVF